MSYLITVAILVVIGCYMYMKVIRPMMSANASGVAKEAADEYEANKAEIFNEFFTNDEKFGMLTKVVGDEEIHGMMNYAEPKSIGGRLAAGLKTAITNVEKVNMDLFFMVLTDKSLHCIESNGENTVDHQIFDLNEIQGMTLGKSGGMNVKDHLAGTSGGFIKMKFNYKGEEYEYNLFPYSYGYPKFKVKETLGENFEREFCIPFTGVETMSSKDFFIDSYVRQKITADFQSEIQKKYNVTFPA